MLLAGGLALWAPDTERQMPMREAFNLAEAKFGTLGATGSYNTPKDVHGEYRGGTIGASPAYSFTAHVAEVEVDVETGFVDVKKIWVAHDCGRALNPVLVEGQMEGSAYMGFAEALMEEQVFKDADHGRAGLHNAPSLLDYRIPTSLDTPELESLIVESIDPEGPYGAKEAGEGPLHPSIPAIANAIYDAVGVRLDRLPFSPPAVWRALRRPREAGGGAAQAGGARPRERHARERGLSAHAEEAASSSACSGCWSRHRGYFIRSATRLDGARVGRYRRGRAAAPRPAPRRAADPAPTWDDADWTIFQAKVRGRWTRGSTPCRWARRWRRSGGPSWGPPTCRTRWRRRARSTW